ncbi:DNA-formamidopyrimidine glycosylase, partial [Pseudomonas aeruginosa]
RNLGPEPLTDAFAGQRLFELSRGRSMAVKPFIMDNAVVVGVGNIYASEALFAADEIAQGGAAALDGDRQDPLDLLRQAQVARLGDAPGGLARIDAGGEQ